MPQHQHERMLKCWFMYLTRPEFRLSMLLLLLVLQKVGSGAGGGGDHHHQRVIAVLCATASSCWQQPRQPDHANTYQKTNLFELQQASRGMAAGCPGCWASREAQVQFPRTRQVHAAVVRATRPLLGKPPSPLVPYLHDVATKP